MSESVVYVPILKWKKGEQEGLSKLPDSVKNQITPLIEITESAPPDQICETLKKCFQNPIYVDTIIADEDDREYLFSVVSELNMNHCPSYPVIYYDDLFSDLNNLISVSPKIGIKIELPLDIEGPEIEDVINKMNDFHNTYNRNIDLIIDLGIIETSRTASLQLRELIDFAQKIETATFYDYIIISCTSFPSSISSVHSGEIGSFHRYDIKIFEKFLSKTNISKNKILYADYGVTKFTDVDSEIDFSIIGSRILDKVRYTTNSEYWIYKGKKDKLHPANSIKYVDLANKLCSSIHYMGKDFSFGDNDIYDRAKGLNKKKGGNHTNWVTISSNHHITVLVEQLANLF